MLGAGAVVDDGVEAAPKGDLLSPLPPAVVPKDMPPKPNDDPAVELDGGGAGAAAGTLSNGFAVLYFCANLANISGSLP